jgi:hypothetical protein
MWMNLKKVVGFALLCLILAISAYMFLGASLPFSGTAAVTSSSGISEGGILKGKWQRPDGGYIIDIRSIEPSSGKIEAAYFNPNPIKVAAAQLKQENSSLNLFIELRDTGYPGCTYKLTYDRQTDQLKGVYYQAAVQESYDIYFVRLNDGK